MNDSERLFAAILQRDFKAADEMTASGVTLDGDIRDALVKGPTNAANFVLARYNYYKQFMDFAAHATAADFAAVAEKLFELVGEPLFNNFGEYRYSSSYNDKFYDPRFFEAVLKYCNGKQMRKQMTMQEIIDKNSVELLELCAKYGWLKLPRIRDAMIEYSQKANRTECTAWLLDFKNRNFDLAAEREKAEKKLEQELNAAPDSVSELKKIWSFKKREDGTLTITSYKGTRGEITVPCKIGKSDVTEIGAYAFAASAPRIKIEQRDFRRKEITRVVLPDTIRIIGENAFSGCEALEQVNIPEGVVEISKEVFTGCRKITDLVIPDTVTKMESGAFAGCLALCSVKLPDSLTEISDYMFSNCRKLQEIKIPAAVQSVGIWAFSRCTSLEEIVIPEGVSEIKRQAFMNCDKLKTVVIPASVKSIKNYIYRKQAPETVFRESPNVTAVVEPKSCAERYCIKHNIAFRYKGDKG